MPFLCVDIGRTINVFFAAFVVCGYCAFPLMANQGQAINSQGIISLGETIGKD
jgi:hypothetical protein